MEENIRKVRISRISTGAHRAVRRGMAHRFSKWCADKYNVNWRGIYESFRGSNVSPWKLEGMTNCVKQFDPEFKGNLRKFWEGCRKNRFAEFMESKGICRATLWKRFQADDWNELEMNGISATYRYWRENIDNFNE